ncbi:hypothetical protein T484DRAFT_2295466 [Baffinella frigidus]|nr:hypothetical protein T484DRAFT_2295466 [Cryptophyta sp. CCMP2293]
MMRLTRPSEQDGRTTLVQPSTDGRGHATPSHLRYRVAPSLRGRGPLPRAPLLCFVKQRART